MRVKYALSHRNIFFFLVKSHRNIQTCKCAHKEMLTRIRALMLTLSIGKVIAFSFWIQIKMSTKSTWASFSRVTTWSSLSLPFCWQFMWSSITSSKKSSNCLANFFSLAYKPLWGFGIELTTYQQQTKPHSS